jgi:hypothetical protein
MTVKQPDDGFVKDIEINDLRNRYLLTKGPTQKQVSGSRCGMWLEKGIRREPFAALVDQQGAFKRVIVPGGFQTSRSQ